MATVAKFDAVGQMKNTTLRIVIVRRRELRLRAWLAVRLIRLAAFVLNCQLEVRMDDTEAQP